MVKIVQRTIAAAGTCRRKYAPAVMGAYRMRAAVAATDVCPHATTPWRAFTVK